MLTSEVCLHLQCHCMAYKFIEKKANCVTYSMSYNNFFCNLVLSFNFNFKNSYGWWSIIKVMKNGSNYWWYYLKIKTSETISQQIFDRKDEKFNKTSKEKVTS